MLKLKLQHFGHLIWRTDSFEKPLMLGKIERRKRRGWQRIRWLDGITNSMGMSLSKLQDSVMDRDGGAWWAAVHGGLEELDMTQWLYFQVSFSFIGEGDGNPLQWVAWTIPGTAEPGGLPSMMSHRVGHAWSDLAVVAEQKLFLLAKVSIVSPSICHEVMGLDAMILVFWKLSFKPTFTLLFHFH